MTRIWVATLVLAATGAAGVFVLLTVDDPRLIAAVAVACAVVLLASFIWPGRRNRR